MTVLLEFFVGLPDEGLEIYVAESGDVFSLDTIQAGNFQQVGNVAFPQDGDFFLAFATNETRDGVSVGGERDVFGWAQVTEGGAFFGDVTLVDSAVAYGTGNIIVGQNAFAAVPEPSSFALLGLVAVGFVGRRRR